METVITTYNRRSFIRTSATAGGGIIFGFNFFAACKPVNGSATLLADAAREWNTINGFIKIAADGIVTIMSPNPEIGQGIKTSMPMIVAEELDVDWTKVVVEQAPLNTELYTRQVAGGSQSIRQGWDSLRTAGATARQMLVNTAAKQWDVPSSECTTEKGVVHHKASGKSVSYGDLAAATVGTPVPEKVELKDPSQYKIIGTSVPNVDNYNIVTGRPLYGIDTKREGMLYGAFTHPPAFGQKLGSIDDSAARAIPGVKDVITFDNNVVVLADNTWHALQGKKALKITWTRDTEAESTTSLDTRMREFLQKSAEAPLRKDGDPERAFHDAATIVEAVYECPFLAHNPMEPMNFFADVTAERADLYGPIQTPEGTRRSVAEKLGMQESQVSIGLSRMGGGFGRRLYGHFVTEAALTSQLAKAPVQLIYTREDDMSGGIYRPACKYLFRAALDAHGNLTGYHIRGVGVNQGSCVRESNFPAAAVENYLAETHNAQSEVTVGAWRAPITNFLAFAEQSFLDEVALKVNKDPVQFRLDLMQRALDNPVGELIYEPARFIEVIKLAAEKSNWGRASDDVKQGFSVYYSHNSYVAHVADVVVQEGKPKVQKMHCAVDCGIVINQSGANTMVEGGTLDGIGHAMYGELTIKEGIAEQQNFDKFRLLRISEAMPVEMHFVNNGKSPTGLGEPALPPAAGAVGNAIFTATGKRLRKQPFVGDELLG
ncbi:MAG TPA: molybdopterin cofactor-binding domain-containing protein [Saprospiraceae bacterium]|nr:molybdopterin cofactor-binding domain-containing protein [Saprospiraceae bacterium]